MKNTFCKILSLVLAGMMLLGVLPGAALAEGKWTEEETADGWVKVTNEGGVTLGYSRKTGIKLLEADGYAFKDLNRNGELDAYEDWRLDAKTRAENIAELLRGEEQAQFLMFLSDNGPKSVIEIGDPMQTHLDLGFRTFTARASSVEDSVKAVNMIQEYAESLPFGIPVDLRGDIGNAVASQWPNHLGFAASFDPELAAEFSRMYSSELRDLGLTTLHHPQMDLASEPRWRRFTGTFGENPELDRDMGTAITNALQSTYDEEGNDLGWGVDSCNALIKHFPGDGAGEGGRESHAFSGKYNVFPGNNFEMHLFAYEDALTGKLPGKTGSAAGVMTNYSISLDANGNSIGDDRTGTTYSAYKSKGLLRDRFNWDGIICTDFGTMFVETWGMEDKTEPERVLKALEAGNDRIEAYSDVDNIRAGFELYLDNYGKTATQDRIQESVRRLMQSFIQIGLFDNPYLSMEESKANVCSADKVEAGHQAMLKAIIMLKNSGNLIQAAGEKKTVYIPMIQKTVGRGQDAKQVWSLPADEALLSEYFNVVTDKVEGDEIVRATAEDVAGCDHAIVFINSPANATINTQGKAPRFGAQAGYNWDDDYYVPLSLQYRPYTADSEFVRKESISGDFVEEDVSDLYRDDYYGQKGMLVKENRTYFGQTAVITNESDLDLVLDTAKICDKVVVVVKATNPFVVSEFESEADAIFMHFGSVSDQAILEIVSGQVEPSALLPMQMPANMETVEKQLEDVPFDMECHVDADGNTYDFGFGLNWSGVISDERTERYSAEKYKN